MRQPRDSFRLLASFFEMMEYRRAMPTMNLIPAAGFALVIACGVAGAQTLAVTEFSNESIDTDGDNNGNSEFIEILNYGGSPVDLTGIAITDNSLYGGRPERAYIFPDGEMLGPGEKLVLTRVVEQFDLAYPGVAAQINVRSWAADGAYQFSNNNPDEVLIVDLGAATDPTLTFDDTVLWNAAYNEAGPSGETADGVSYFLTSSSSAGFTVTDYGRVTAGPSGAVPTGGGVVPAGIDQNAAGSTGVIGYEASTSDPGVISFRSGNNMGTPGDVAPLTSHSDGFEGFAVGDFPTGSTGVWFGNSNNDTDPPNVQVVSDSGTNFLGDNTNQYVSITDDSTRTESVETFSANLGRVATLSVDFYEPANPSPGADGADFLVRLQGVDNDNGVRNFADIRLNDGDVIQATGTESEPTAAGAYSENTAQTLVVIGNLETSSAAYDGGAAGPQSVAAESVDVWVGPQGGTLTLVLDDVPLDVGVDEFGFPGPGPQPDAEFVTAEFRTFGGGFDDLPGDFNRDGFVDAADYAFFRENEGTDNDLGGQGDETGLSAGIVDQADYDLWAAALGGSVPINNTNQAIFLDNFSVVAGASLGASLGVAVPEPSTAVMVVAIGLLIRPRRLAILHLRDELFLRHA